VSGLVPGLRTRRPRVRSPCSPRHGSNGTSRIEKAPGLPVVHRLGTAWGRKGPRTPTEIRPPMEGTSGAAEAAPLRGGTVEAALEARHRVSAGLRRACSSSGALESTARDWRTRLQPQAPASNATGGVRADRVGAKLSWRAIATRGAGIEGRSRSSLGPWPVKSRLALFGEPPVRRLAPAREKGGGASPRGDLERGVRGSGGSTVVLVDRG
jgi:hypothetical protein